METALYYFTGTGNSLWFAKLLQELIPSCELKAIAQAVAENLLVVQEEKVGFVFPLYFYGLPEIVLRFIRESDLSAAKYTFVVVTHGGPPFVEGGAVEQMEALLAQKGLALDASFMQWMPGNFILTYGGMPRFIQSFLLKNAQRRVGRIAKIISDGRSHHERGNPLVTKTVAAREYERWLPTVFTRDEGFWVTDACNGCGTCEKVCPVGNVRLQDGLPRWHHTCQQCLACIQYCPKEAVQYGEVTQKRRRYRNPYVKVSEIIRQNSG
ncbi:MAG: EFR1 family ferrodoxin [Anaerolineae bacterium]|nr:EFR1 family ferrodoxin [Anaerolineae bacterium]